MQWETVIGLEVHVQLATQSKLFSDSPTDFGAEANSQASAADMAMPGTLPVTNEQAVINAIKFGLAVNAEIHPAPYFECKNYFYPDLPKGYQTSQNDAPIVVGGGLDITLANGESKHIRIHHAHLEDDAGKSIHEGLHGFTGIDLNRAGVGLIEIVSEPDMRNAEEAVAYAKKLHSIVTSLGISDGDMSQGSMRFDVNISVRPKGQEQFGTRTETKNLNSFRFMEDAIELEVERQIEVLENGGSIVQETRLYNGETGEARSMRIKEEADDYRYFPCPELLPIDITPELIESIRKDLPELPEQRIARFISDYQLSEYDAKQLGDDFATASYFEHVAVGCKDAKLAANWVMVELSALLNRLELSIAQSPVAAEQLALLITRIKDNTISSKMAKDVFDDLANNEGSVDDIIKNKGLSQVSDESALIAMIQQVLDDNPKQVEQYKAAEEDKRKKMSGFFVGQVMKASKGQANPAVLNKLLNQLLNG